MLGHQARRLGDVNAWSPLALGSLSSSEVVYAVTSSETLQGGPSVLTL